MKEGIIYMATSPSGNSYIGQTTYQLEKRIVGHRNAAKTKTTKFCYTIRKYGDSIKGKIWKK